MGGRDLPVSVGKCWVKVIRSTRICPRDACARNGAVLGACVIRTDAEPRLDACVCTGRLDSCVHRVVR